MTPILVEYVDISAMILLIICLLIFLDATRETLSKKIKFQVQIMFLSLLLIIILGELLGN